MCNHLSKKGFSCTQELSVNNVSSLRADVIGCTIRGTIFIAEIKSCVRDYTSDKKILNYLSYCDRFFLVITSITWQKLKKKNVEIDPRIGVLVQLENGNLKSVKKSKSLPLSDKRRLILLARLAWRSGEFSKRTLGRK